MIWSVRQRKTPVPLDTGVRDRRQPYGASPFALRGGGNLRLLAGRQDAEDAALRLALRLLDQAEETGLALDEDVLDGLGRLAERHGAEGHRLLLDGGLELGRQVGLAGAVDLRLDFDQVALEREGALTIGGLGLGGLPSSGSAAVELALHEGIDQLDREGNAAAYASPADWIDHSEKPGSDLGAA